MLMKDFSGIYAEGFCIKVDFLHELDGSRTDIQPVKSARSVLHRELKPCALPRSIGK